MDNKKISNDSKILEEMIPEHKMGFKILTELQLRNMFPTYENLFEKINVHRQKIQSFDTKKMSQLDYQYNMMYDTIFSIFGARGSGKTSAVFTLKKMIREKYEPYGDYVFPIIMPEMIPETCDLISWILAILGEAVTDLEKQLEKDSELIRDNDFFKDCRFRRDNRLRQEYNYIRELYFAKGYDVGREKSLEAAIGSNGIQVQYSYEFAHKLIMFWATLKEAIAKAKHLEPGREPLIYFIFDDVDLTPNKVEEMLSTIIKYLSHPNIIVIVTADEELFNDVVEEKLQGKIGAYARKYEYNRSSLYYPFSEYDSYLLQQEKAEKQKLQSMAHLYLGKVLPPSLRYYIMTFNTCNKRRGFIESVKGWHAHDAINVETFLRQQVNKLKECGAQTVKEYDNFMYYGNGFIETYLLFWGNTSRQLANECFLVEELFKQLIHIYNKHTYSKERSDNQNIIEEIYQQIYHFLYNSINTDGDMQLEKEETESLINYVWNKYYDQWPLYIRYDYLNEYYNKKISIELEREKGEQWHKIVNIVLKMYILLFFVENLLLILEKIVSGNTIYPKVNKRQKGCRSLVTFLDSLTKEGMSLARCNKSNDLDSLLYHYGWLMERIDLVTNFDFRDRVYAQDYLYTLDSKVKVNMIFSEEMLTWSKENPKWFTTMVTIVYLQYSGWYLLNERNIRNLGVDKRVNLYDIFVARKRYELEELIQSNLLNGRLETDTPSAYDFLESLRQSKEVKTEERDIDSRIKRTVETMGNPKNLDVIEELINSVSDGIEDVYYYLIQRGIFPKNVVLKDITRENSAIQLETLLNYMKNKLAAYSKKFKFYRIKDEGKFNEVLQHLLTYVEEDDSIRGLTPEIDTDGMYISVKALENLHESLLDSYVRIQKEPWVAENTMNLQKWNEIIDQLELKIDDMYITDAIDYVAIWNVVNHLQQYYIPAYIEGKKKQEMAESVLEGGNDSRFSRKFFDAMKEAVISEGENFVYKDNGGYLKILITNQIERGAREYYNRITKKGIRDDE